MVAPPSVFLIKNGAISQYGWVFGSKSNLSWKLILISNISKGTAFVVMLLFPSVKVAVNSYFPILFAFPIRYTEPMI